jgi:hypothetical protein
MTPWAAIGTCGSGEEEVETGNVIYFECRIM